ncbi:carboxypeptidase regulatory-like domain-containing protein [Hyalangium sp.]|uniref:carboxypeptidase regulatory-like domain-containing protein n=1 Tax=Hyalangium sp. TaxID=2028555 RepID=UPI002D488D98|nr:carboxypeptidase regulatory-like domain-containing protein [Hyalangium sp.]HYH97459.1 carboxypeptidase regulatory-like domain-containing protein [Hyalangium sp.]
MSLLRSALILSLLFTLPATAAQGDPKVREAAQRGITFLARSTAAWQQQHQCYGCHVQAVTLEGLAVGKHHQYEVPAKELSVILEGVLHSKGGARTAGGLSQETFPRTARAFGGVAFARYDQYVDSKLRDDLLKLARTLLEYQQKDGSVQGDHESPPVSAGLMQATYQGMQTWRQAYARTADDAWLAPIRRAEEFIARRAASWEGKPQGVYLQDVNYALLGLTAAGASRSEELAGKVARHLVSLQQQDGGWGFSTGASDPFATGQTVYALRQAGFTEEDTPVARGIRWLVSHQKADGGWGASGSGKAEALWAVLGLVSVDVVSVAVSGIRDGEHVASAQTIQVEARDNQGKGIQKVEVLIDDRSVQTAQGGKLSYTWDTKGLSDGKHTVDVVATNTKGQVSRRRLEVYAGNVFLTSLGSRFSANGTELAARNIAPKERSGRVELRVLAAGLKDGQPQPGAEVFKETRPSAQGPVTFTFGGKGKDGKALRTGRYFAEFSFVDEKGAVLQQERLLFTHDTPESQYAQYGEVAGGLALGNGQQASNAVVELVDEKGRVVQATRSNETGQYRFKSVDKGEYKVRVRKEGFKDAEMPVSSAPATQAAADVTLH